MDVITDPEVDAVWICSPSSYHAEQIKACAANGKHVFCEKPIATDLAETVEAINACNEAGVKLMTGLQRRFDPNFRRVHQAIQDNEVGDSIMVSVCDHVRVIVIYLRSYHELIFPFGSLFDDERSNCAPVILPLLHLNT
jgi:predicted dehydrogenase